MFETQHIELLPRFQFTAVKKNRSDHMENCVSVKGGQGRLCLFLINALQNCIAFQNSPEFRCSFALKLLHFLVMYLCCVDFYSELLNSRSC